jgi:hypothetical protein
VASGYIGGLALGEVIMAFCADELAAVAGQDAAGREWRALEAALDEPPDGPVADAAPDDVIAALERDGLRRLILAWSDAVATVAGDGTSGR